MATVDPRVFRTYDIRALVPELVDADSEYYGQVGTPDSYQAPLEPGGVREIGRALATLFEAPAVAIGYDSRISSPDWCAALTSGLTDRGVNVVQLGLCTTDVVYYASGKLDIPAVMVTASHCTRELNGMKLVRAGARVVGSGSGMEDLRDIVLNQPASDGPAPGQVTSADLIPEYVKHLLSFVDTAALRPMHIVADAGNGAGGVVAGPLLDQLRQITSRRLFFEPDGRFPNHEANPFERKNIEDMVALLKGGGYDFGVAWDGDADRCFFVDENGEPVPGDFITTLVARHFLRLYPGSAIVYDLRASWAVRDWVTRLGGRPIAERVGHSFIKQTMRAENAVFGGEVSGHYYFRDHYYADNGFIPLLSVLHMLTETGQTLSELVQSLGTYHISGEINSRVGSTDSVLAAVRDRYSDADIDLRDGVTLTYPTWHCNVRPSANDPVVRLNVEARTPEELRARTDELLAIIRSGL